MTDIKTLTEIGYKYGFERRQNRGTKVINQGGDKCLGEYPNTQIYTTHLEQFRKKNINFLEIGIFQGRSLAMWNEYFENGNIYGIDINLTEFNIYKKELIEKYNAFEKKDVIVKQGNSSRHVLSFGVEFDFILDDGSHILNDQFRTYLNYFKFLKKGGLYIIEDIGWHPEKIRKMVLDYSKNDIKEVFFDRNKMLIIQKL